MKCKREEELYMIIDYLECLLDIGKVCLRFTDFTMKEFFTDDKGKRKDTVDAADLYFCYTPAYRKDFDIIKQVVETCDLFGIKYLERSQNDLRACVYGLEGPLTVHYRANFEFLMEKMRQRFDHVKDEIKEKISLLNPAEIDRLNEAIHCFLEGCYYSSVAMSVHAIEFRLFSLMMSICPDSKLEELTLGQLIREYLNNKETYGNVIPKKHEPLLEHCNTYRIFSVHPKKEQINKPIASSILNMTFLFLLDKKLVEKAKKLEAI